MYVKLSNKYMDYQPIIDGVRGVFFYYVYFLSTINAKWNMNICVYHEHITEIVDNDCICAYIVLIAYANRFWNSAISVACIVWFKHIHITYHNMCLYIYYNLIGFAKGIHELEISRSIGWWFEISLGSCNQGPGCWWVILSDFRSD